MIYNTNMLTRAMNTLESQRGRLTLIVQKVDANHLYYPNPTQVGGAEWNQMFRDLKTSYKKTGETWFFELYE